MPARVINQLSIHDTADRKEYGAKVGPSLARHGGRQSVGGPPVARLEGDFELPQRVAILEFPTIDHAKAMWNDPEYAPLIRARQACTEGRAVVFDGKERSRPGISPAARRRVRLA